MQCLLDTGPLVAALSRGNAADQIWARKQIRSFERPLITCDAVLTEASHFLGGPTSIVRLIVEGLSTSKFDSQNASKRLLEFSQKYRDLPMDYADACLVCMAETQPRIPVLTFDKKDFNIYRIAGGRHLKLLTPP